MLYNLQSLQFAIPSLHIQGASDPFLSSSKKLEEMYDPNTRTQMLHGEEHNIPSIRTELYPLIKSWVHKTTAN